MALNIFRKLFSREERGASGDITLFDTLHRKKQAFVPIRAGHVGMYHCGPTVYGPTHIGHARAYVFADIVKRLFLYKGYEVKQVINITDVGHLTDDEDQGQDKIEEGARREQKTAAEITKLYTDDFLANLEKLNVDTTGTLFPKATDHILEQIAFVRTLEEKGYTYKTSDGIYFDTSRFPRYGELGNVDVKGLREGARVSTNAERKHPTDFALWKFSRPNEQRQQEWPSPWGIGFPGWHIECSAMSTKLLGHRFDIHTGGIDHIPVHHNNEIAQSEAAFGEPFVNYWMHVEHVMVDGKKIAKSLGNAILLKHLEEKGISPLAYRYWLLTSHYRTQVNFTWEALEAANRAYRKLIRIFVEELGTKTGKMNKVYRDGFVHAVCDDFDTPKAVATMWNMLKDASVAAADKRATLLDFDRVLGLDLASAAAFLDSSRAKTLDVHGLPETIQKLIEEREAKRKAKDFAGADALRAELSGEGYDIIDTETGPKVVKRL